VLVQIATGEKPFGDGASFVLINSAKKKEIKKKQISRRRCPGACPESCLSGYFFFMVSW
jgi:hypothetical protein